MASGRLDEGRHRHLGEACEREALHALDPTQIGQQLSQGMAAANLAVPVGGDHQQAEGVAAMQDVTEQ